RFRNVFLWHTRGANCSLAYTLDPRFDNVIYMDTTPRIVDDGVVDAIPATPDAIQDYIDRTAKLLPEKERFRKRLHDSLLSNIPDEAEVKANWLQCAHSATKESDAEYDQHHAELLRGVVCGLVDDDHRAIVAGITRNWLSNSALENHPARLPLARLLVGLD